MASAPDRWPRRGSCPSGDRTPRPAPGRSHTLRRLCEHEERRGRRRSRRQPWQMPISRQARITRTAISPRLAIRIFLNILWPVVRPFTILLARAAWNACDKSQPSVIRRTLGFVSGAVLPCQAGSMKIASTKLAAFCPLGTGYWVLGTDYLFLVHHDSAGAGLFFRLGLFGGHGLVNPLVRRLQVGGVRCLDRRTECRRVRGTSGSCRPWRRHSRDEAAAPCSDCRCLPEHWPCFSP